MVHILHVQYVRCTRACCAPVPLRHTLYVLVVVVQSLKKIQVHKLIDLAS
jgi:hypothetical protein